MDDFILYEELGAGSSSVVYKARKKGSLDYVSIVCADKVKRPDISNHVRLSHHLDHQNIVGFYEWYETQNNLWLVVELCTGGSLESLIDDDGCLSEDVVRRCGWDLVKGLKHIHESGIIFSDLTPAKILLDGSGTLMFGNFRYSKAVGETLEDFLTLFSTCVEAGEEDVGENFDNMRKRLQGSPAYRAPEVLQGSETNVKSDLWALGCTIYYMYTGKPPFISESCSELRDMIIQQDTPPPTRTGFSTSPPSEDFHNLLRGLLKKSPDERMDWQELLDHPFWTPVRRDEDEGGRREDEHVGPASLRASKIHDSFSAGQTVEFPISHRVGSILQRTANTSKKEMSSRTTDDCRNHRSPD